MATYPYLLSFSLVDILAYNSIHRASMSLPVSIGSILFQWSLAMTARFGREHVGNRPIGDSSEWTAQCNDDGAEHLCANRYIFTIPVPIGSRAGEGCV
jgi:hypothetical protein